MMQKHAPHCWFHLTIHQGSKCAYENSIFGSSEILQCLPCVHTYIRPSTINGQNNILTKFLPTEHEYITMHGLLVTLKNLFVRTEHDYITCMTWQFPVKNRLRDNMSITMHGTSIFSNPVYISLYFPPSSNRDISMPFLALSYSYSVQC